MRQDKGFLSDSGVKERGCYGARYVAPTGKGGYMTSLTRMIIIVSLSFLLVFLLVATAVVSASDESAGSLRNSKGDVVIERHGSVVRAENGAAIFPNDTVKTGADGSVGIIFKDNSRLSLGPNSRLEIKDYVFKPAQGQFSMINKLIKGTASFVSGKMTKLSPESVILETPTSTIGVRGTTFNVKVNEE